MRAYLLILRSKEELTKFREDVILALLHGEGFFNVIEAWRDLDKKAQEPI